jgi:hypothetical protein
VRLDHGPRARDAKALGVAGTALLRVPEMREHNYLGGRHQLSPALSARGEANQAMPISRRGKAKLDCALSEGCTFVSVERAAARGILKDLIKVIKERWSTMRGSQAFSGRQESPPATADPQSLCF